MRPGFDDLVGSDLEPDERARLERVHELLLAAGAPPDLAQAAQRVGLQTRSRRGVLLALAAALALASFAVGAYVVGSPEGRTAGYEESMRGTDAAPDAEATLLVFEADAAGNWPMELRIEGLEPTASGRPFELWLTRDDQLAALCGAFRTSQDGSAVVPMNAPYRFDDYDEWVIVEAGSATALLET